VTDNPVCWTRSGTGSGANTIASGPSRRTCPGESAASYCITTRDTHATWAVEVEDFLTHLGSRRVSASTQNHAKSAILFLYKEVLGEPLP
jgi:hypothetical protein